MHGKPLAALHDGWNGSHAAAAIGSIARINRRLAANVPTAINRSTRRCDESIVVSFGAANMLMITMAKVVGPPAVHRVSAILAAAHSAAEFQERAAAAAIAPEAQVSLVE